MNGERQSDGDVQRRMEAFALEPVSTLVGGWDELSALERIKLLSRAVERLDGDVEELSGNEAEWLMDEYARAHDEIKAVLSKVMPTMIEIFGRELEYLRDTLLGEGEES